jgi:Fic family protein
MPENGPPPAFRDLISRAEHALARLDGAFQALPQSESISSLLLRHEAVASGNLEGIQASMLDLLDLESGLTPIGPPRDVAELRALTDVLAHPPTGDSRVERLQSLGARFNSALEFPPGWRRSPMWVGASGATQAEARYVPPPPQEIPQLLMEWDQSKDESGSLHPLVKLARDFAHLERLYPFEQANGRLARAWLQHQLVRGHFLAEPVLCFSTQLRGQRHAMHQAQHAFRERHESREWIELLLDLIARAADETTELVRRAGRLVESHRRQLWSGMGRVAGPALVLHDALLSRPVIGIKDVIELTGTTFPAANELARRMVREGLLVEITGQARHRRFRYAPYVRIFLDED